MNKQLDLTLGLVLAVAGSVFQPTSSRADNTPQPVPLVQKWADASLITADNDWSRVPGFTGYRGDKITTKVGVNPQTLLADGTDTVVNVFANQGKPNTFRSGGVAEFDGIPDPAIALKGSGNASAPFLLLSLNTTGKKNVGVGYTLRDLDGAVNNAVQPVAFQYRVGTNGNFTDLPSAFTADATTGPSLSSQTTPVVVSLPASTWNQSFVQVRWVTSNAEGNDEWVGIDDIAVVADENAPEPAAEARAGTDSKPFQPLRSPRDAANR